MHIDSAWPFLQCRSRPGQGSSGNSHLPYWRSNKSYWYYNVLSTWSYIVLFALSSQATSCYYTPSKLCLPSAKSNRRHWILHRQLQRIGFCDLQVAWARSSSDPDQWRSKECIETQTAHVQPLSISRHCSPCKSIYVFQVSSSECPGCRFDTFRTSAW